MPVATRGAAQANPVFTKSGLGNTWAHAYDANGNPQAAQLVVDGAQIDSRYTIWDALDRPSRNVDSAGNAGLSHYNPPGNLIGAIGPDGYTVGFDRDPLGRVTGAYNEEGQRSPCN